jgi:hypothetical protein
MSFPQVVGQASCGDRVRDDELRGLVRDSRWLMRALAVVRDSGLPDAWIGAGTVRDLVWGERYGAGFEPLSVRDVDVVFFDPSDLRPGLRQTGHPTTRGGLAGTALGGEEPGRRAHWYQAKFGGGPVPPFRDIAEAVATWPEYATAVAVRLDRHGHIDVCAPYGLDDLFDGVWRRNPTRVSLEISRHRPARHRPAERWSGVRVVT